MSVITIRDVPEHIRSALSDEARRRGQSLQSYLLGILRRQAGFSRNRSLITEIDGELSVSGGADAQAPAPAVLLAEARAERDPWPGPSIGNGE